MWRNCIWLFILVSVGELKWSSGWAFSNTPLRPKSWSKVDRRFGEPRGNDYLRGFSLLLSSQGTAEMDMDKNLSSMNTAHSTVDELFQILQRRDKDDEDQKALCKELMEQLILQNQTSKLNDNSANDTVDWMELIGYYNVSITLTRNPKENPVGGKWTRNRSGKAWWKIRSLQHVLPPSSQNEDDEAVAQVINLIRLDAAKGWLRRFWPTIWVVLRGDAVPLSAIEENWNATDASSQRPLIPNLTARTVRAYFDAPRIAFGRRFVLSLGPPSQVVLDTPYVDNRVRIGQGGTSGTLFLFSRTGDDSEEWKWIVDPSTMVGQQKTLSRALWIVGAAWGVLSRLLLKSPWLRRLATGTAALLFWAGWAIRQSSGGIEQDLRASAKKIRTGASSS